MRYVSPLNTIVFGQNRMAGLLFKRLQETSTVILPRKPSERGWEYHEYPLQARGLLGQNKADRENVATFGNWSGKP
jgi:hypothetical protein